MIKTLSILCWCVLLASCSSWANDPMVAPPDQTPPVWAPASPHKPEAKPAPTQDERINAIRGEVRGAKNRVDTLREKPASGP